MYKGENKTIFWSKFYMITRKTLVYSVLIALSICSVTNPTVNKAIKCLSKLKFCDAYATYILDKADGDALRSLLINTICEPKFYQEY